MKPIHTIPETNATMITRETTPIITPNCQTIKVPKRLSTVLIVGLKAVVLGEFEVLGGGSVAGRKIYRKIIISDSYLMYELMSVIRGQMEGETKYSIKDLPMKERRYSRRY